MLASNMQCDSATGPQQGRCPAIACPVTSEECKYVLKFEKISERTCCPVCYAENEQGVQCAFAAASAILDKKVYHESVAYRAAIMPSSNYLDLEAQGEVNTGTDDCQKLTELVVLICLSSLVW